MEKMQGYEELKVDPYILLGIQIKTDEVYTKAHENPELLSQKNLIHNICFLQFLCKELIEKVQALQGMTDGNKFTNGLSL